jgi:hypothetical protein
MTDKTFAQAESQGHITSASLVIQHVVRPDAFERYEAWLREISAKAAQHPGHQGVHFIRPVEGTNTYTIVIRFATIEDASRWVSSDERNALVARISDALEKGDTTNIEPGIEFWFSPPAGAPRRARPWKQWLVTTSVIWPLTMIVPAVLKPVFGAVPALGVFGVSHLITAALIVAIVTWLVMPSYVKLVSRWLFR